MSDITTGLRIVYRPQRVTADIVFVHGITGHRELTWSSNGNQPSWLETLLPTEVPYAQILTFGYDAKVADWKLAVSQNRIGDHSRKLLHDVTNFRERDGGAHRPLIFVAHSLGGLVCEDALLNSRNATDGEAHLQQVNKSTKGIIFLGTPHSGSGLAQWATWFVKAIKPVKQMATPIVEVLKRDSEVLARIQTDFHTMIRAKSQNGFEFKIVCFYEELQLPLLGFVVPYDSAILPAYPHIGIHADHMNMTKFKNQNDPGFVAISSELRRWTSDCKPSSDPNVQILELPYQRHPSFIGRDQVIDDIERCLKGSSYAVLAGIGGVGKSETAIEVCYRRLERTPRSSIFWASVDTISKMEQSYINIAKKLGLAGWDNREIDVLCLVKNYLSDEYENPWLMVLDNADELDMFVKANTTSRNMPLENFIPRSTKGQILITTRNVHVGQVLTRFTGTIEIVTALSSLDAEKLFRSGLQIGSMATEKTIHAILEILDNLPLAITQATSYIKWNNISATQYFLELQECEAGLHELLSTEQFDWRRGLDKVHSVVRSWKLSFDAIKKENTRAAELLCIMAQFNRHSIPRELLRRPGETQHQLTVALGLLQAFSLVKLEFDENGMVFISLHRLVQTVTRAWNDLVGGRQRSHQEALELVASKFPEIGYGTSLDEKSFCRSLLPHTEAVLAVVITDNETQLSQAKLLYKVSIFQLAYGNFNLAEAQCTFALQIWQGRYGPDSPTTIDMESLRGQILLSQERSDEAQVIQEAVLRRRTLLFGSEGLQTLQTKSHLIDVYADQGRLREAEDYAIKVFEVRERLLSPLHPKTISSGKTLAYIAILKGEFTRGSELARKSLKIAGQVLGIEHPMTLECEALLACSLVELCKYEEAAHLLANVLQKRRLVLGERHPHTIVAIIELATLERRVGKYAESETLFRTALHNLESTMGLDHLLTLNCAACMAAVLREQGKHTEALPIAQDNLGRRERIFGLDSSEMLVAQIGIAKLYDKMGSLELARPIAKRAFDDTRRVLGDEDDLTLASMTALASIFAQQGDLIEARDLLEKTVHIRQRKLAPNHPCLLADQVELAKIKQRQRMD